MHRKIETKRMKQIQICTYTNKYKPFFIISQQLILTFTQYQNTLTNRHIHRNIGKHTRKHTKHIHNFTNKHTITNTSFVEVLFIYTYTHTYFLIINEKKSETKINTHIHNDKHTHTHMHT